MTNNSTRALFWAPRILAILFALFISMFALDVFDETEGFLQTLGALAMHLIPTYLIVLFIVLAWRWELIGTIGFAGLAAAFFFIGRGPISWMAILFIPGPLLIIAVLFLLSWRRRHERDAVERTNE